MCMPCFHSYLCMCTIKLCILALYIGMFKQLPPTFAPFYPFACFPLLYHLVPSTLLDAVSYTSFSSGADFQPIACVNSLMMYLYINVPASAFVLVAIRIIN